jgi:hypothetical protein
LMLKMVNPINLTTSILINFLIVEHSVLFENIAIKEIEESNFTVFVSFNTNMQLYYCYVYLDLSTVAYCIRVLMHCK